MEDTPAIAKPANQVQNPEPEQNDLFKTPTPTGEKKPKFNLSELDQKQKTIIPEAVPKQTNVETTTEQEVADKERAKPHKKSRKKRKFEQMLGGFDSNICIEESKAGAPDVPFGQIVDESSEKVNQQSNRYLED